MTPRQAVPLDAAARPASADARVVLHGARAPDTVDTTSSPSAGQALQLDAQAVARLQALDPDGRTGVVMRVLGAFETSLARMLVQLAAEAVDGDPTVVCSIAHTLKSSSASVGALELARTCGEVEHRLRNGQGGELANDVRRLMTDGEAALAAVGAMLRP